MAEDVRKSKGIPEKLEDPEPERKNASPGRSVILEPHGIKRLLSLVQIDFGFEESEGSIESWYFDNELEDMFFENYGEDEDDLGYSSEDTNDSENETGSFSWSSISMENISWSD